MLEGKQIRLRLRDREDLDFFHDFWNAIDFCGEYEVIQPQISRTQAEKRIESVDQSDSGVNWTWFVIEKQDGTKIGFVLHYTVQPAGIFEVGYASIPGERGKGYGTEALQIMIDYLFLTRDIMRVQATSDPRNKPSRRILEKLGFKMEGTIRKSGICIGEWVDDCLYSILRDEWKEPKILTRTT